MFDLIYGISIFTHFDEDYQFAWLKEMRRIAKADSILLFTIRDEFKLSCLNENHRNSIEKEFSKSGFCCFETPVWKDTFPDFYKGTWHSRDYIYREWSKYFEIIDYLPGVAWCQQTIVLLRKR